MNKEAGIGDLIARRLRSVARRAELAGEAAGREGFLGGNPAGGLNLAANLVSAKASLLGSAARGARGAANLALRPGQHPAFHKAHEMISSVPRTPLILAGITIPATVLGMQRASKDSDYLQTMTDAQAQGELPMSEMTFNTFAQRRKHGAQMEKRAVTAKALSGGFGAIDDLIKKLLYKSDEVTDAVYDLAETRATSPQMALQGMRPQIGPDDLAGAAGMMSDVTSRIGPGGAQRFFQESFDPRKALGVGAGAVGLGIGADILGEPLVEGIQGAMGFGGPSLKDEAASSFAKETGKQTAGMLGDLTRMVAGHAANAIEGVPLSREQRRVFGHAVKMDPLLSGATDHEISMLERSFKTMVRFAPQLATDEFAVRNYLRESLMSSSGGPDYGTIGNLARTSQTIEGK